MEFEGIVIGLNSKGAFTLFRDALSKAKRDGTIDAVKYLKYMKYSEAQLWAMCMKGLFKNIAGNNNHKLYFCLTCTNRSVSSYMDLIKANVTFVYMTPNSIELEIDKRSVLAEYKCFEVVPCKDGNSIYFKWNLSRKPGNKGLTFKL
jgi:hypothetical protein